MTLRAADLPESHRRHILDALKEHLGADAFGRLRSQYDEESLIDLALRSAQNSVSTRSDPASRAWVWFAVLWLAITIAAASLGGWPAGVAVFFAPVVYCVIGGNANAFGAFGWLGALVMIAVTIVVMAVLPKPWQETAVIFGFFGGPAAFVVMWMAKKFAGDRS